jgi:hypothetical protein
VVDGLSLLANTVMAWNTMQMQAIMNRWANRRQFIETDIMAKNAPTRLSGGAYSGFLWNDMRSI